MQCGLACLQMICDFFGTNYSLETISRYCFATTEGTSLRSINEAALKLGFHTIVGKVTIPQLKEASLPCILYWNQKHFIILCDIKKRKKKNIYYIADPAKGLLKYTEEDFKENWFNTFVKNEEAGIALFLQPTPAFYEKQEEHK